MTENRYRRGAYLADCRSLPPSGYTAGDLCPECGKPLEWGQDLDGRPVILECLSCAFRCKDDPDESSRHPKRF